jgi:hypothetical protein
MLILKFLDVPKQLKLQQDRCTSNNLRLSFDHCGVNHILSFFQFVLESCRVLHFVVQLVNFSRQLKFLVCDFHHIFIKNAHFRQLASTIQHLYFKTSKLTLISSFSFRSVYHSFISFNLSSTDADFFSASFKLNSVSFCVDLLASSCLFNSKIFELAASNSFFN